jgi:hypothetical protein
MQARYTTNQLPALTAQGHNLLVIQTHAVKDFTQMVSRAGLAIRPGGATSCIKQKDD